MDNRESFDAEQESGFHIADVAALAWRQRRIFVGTVMIVTVIAIATSLLVRKEYTSTASFTVAPGQEGGIASLLDNPLGAVFGGRGEASLDRLVIFLNSKTTRHLIVSEFRLKEYYKTPTLTEAIVGLGKRTDVIVTPEATVDVGVRDWSPEQAAMIANRYLQIADSLYTKSSTTHARQVRIFMEGRLRETRVDLAAAEDSAQVFAERTGIISLPDQVTALVQEMATVEAEMRTLEVKIGAGREIFGPSHSSVRQMEVERVQLSRQRSSLMESRGFAGVTDPLVTLKDVPDRAVRYARLKREVGIQSLILKMLMQEYETSKLNEARDVPALTVIDRATTPELRSWPRRTQIVVISGVMSVIWGLFLAWLADAWPGMARRFRGAASARR
jgi:tyrosine-protein kinase Etk/Wzc